MIITRDKSTWPRAAAVQGWHLWMFHAGYEPTILNLAAYCIDPYQWLGWEWIACDNRGWIEYTGDLHAAVDEERLYLVAYIDIENDHQETLGTYRYSVFWDGRYDLDMYVTHWQPLLPPMATPTPLEAT